MKTITKYFLVVNKRLYLSCPVPFMLSARFPPYRRPGIARLNSNCIRSTSCPKQFVELQTPVGSGHPPICGNRRVILRWSGGSYHYSVNIQNMHSWCLDHWLYSLIHIFPTNIPQLQRRKSDPVWTYVVVGCIISDWEQQGHCCHILVTAINNSLVRNSKTGFLSCLQAMKVQVHDTRRRRTEK